MCRAMSPLGYVSEPHILVQVYLCIFCRGRIPWGGGFANPLSIQADAFSAEVVNGNQSPGLCEPFSLYFCHSTSSFANSVLVVHWRRDSPCLMHRQSAFDILPTVFSLPALCSVHLVHQAKEMEGIHEHRGVCGGLRNSRLGTSSNQQCVFLGNFILLQRWF